MPSCSAGPLNGADCPSTTVLSVMPSAQAARVDRFVTADARQAEAAQDAGLKTEKVPA